MVVEEALAVQETGATMLLVEAVPPEVMEYIWKTLAIPVLSIGAGPHCDRQLLIVSDSISQFQAFTPKFVKKYCNVAEVKNVTFPDEDKYCYKMIDGEQEKFLDLMN